MSRTTQGGMLAQLGLLGVALMITVLAASSQSQQSSGARLFVGSRLIVGDGSSIENSGVVETGRSPRWVERARCKPRGRGTYRPGRQDGHAHAGERSLAPGIRGLPAGLERTTRETSRQPPRPPRLLRRRRGDLDRDRSRPSSPSGFSGSAGRKGWRSQYLFAAGAAPPKQWSKRRLPQRHQVQRSPHDLRSAERDRRREKSPDSWAPKASSSSRSGSTTGTAGSPSCSQTCMARSSTKLTNTTSRSSRTRRRARFENC